MRAYCIYLRTIDNIAACMQSRMSDAGHLPSSASADLKQMCMDFFLSRLKKNAWHSKRANF